MFSLLEESFWQGSREGVEEGAYEFLSTNGKNSLGGTHNRSEVPWDCIVMQFYHGERAIIAVLVSDVGRALYCECARNTTFEKTVSRRN
jgi:hypothetical protein